MPKDRIAKITGKTHETATWQGAMRDILGSTEVTDQGVSTSANLRHIRAGIGKQKGDPIVWDMTVPIKKVKIQVGRNESGQFIRGGTRLPGGVDVESGYDRQRGGAFLTGQKVIRWGTSNRA